MTTVVFHHLIWPLSASLIKSVKLESESNNIPLIFQNAIFGLSLFAIAVLKKVHNRTGYSSLFSRRQSQKSNRPKPSILKDQGYITSFKDKGHYLKQMYYHSSSTYSQSERSPSCCVSQAKYVLNISS